MAGTSVLSPSPNKSEYIDYESRQVETWWCCQVYIGHCRSVQTNSRGREETSGTIALRDLTMEIFVSLSRGQISSPQDLARIVGVRVLDYRPLSEGNGFAVFAFVAFADDDSGDYDLCIAKLRQQGLVANSYKLVKITNIARNFQSVHDASVTMDKLDPGKYMGVASLSSPPPLQSAIFRLSDFEIQFTPKLQALVDNWASVQDIAPLRYAVVNPRTEDIEVAFTDASAYNSPIINDMLRNSLYAALGDYSAGRDYSLPGRALV